MRAVYYGYFVTVAVGVIVGGYFWTLISLGGDAPAAASTAPALALVAGMLFTFEGLAMALDWRGAVSRFQAIRDSGDASRVMRFLTWVPSRPRMSFVTEYRIVGGFLVFEGVCMLGLFVVMLGYGAWR